MKPLDNLDGNAIRLLLEQKQQKQREAFETAVPIELPPCISSTCPHCRDRDCPVGGHHQHVAWKSHILQGVGR